MLFIDKIFFRAKTRHHIAKYIKLWVNRIPYRLYNKNKYKTTPIIPIKEELEISHYIKIYKPRLSSEYIWELQDEYHKSRYQSELSFTSLEEVKGDIRMNIPYYDEINSFREEGILWISIYCEYLVKAEKKENKKKNKK